MSLRDAALSAGNLGSLDNDEPLRTRPLGWLLEAFSVTAVVVTLEIIVFHEYFTGRSIPPADFLSSYNTEAFAWWRDGSFFQPPQWMAYMWGGYPGTLDLQNSSWYLPVGAISAVTSFDLHASAVLSALHVGFGAVGMYMLGRAWGLTRTAALFGLTLWFFVSGFYAHAEHLDIMRGYAWLPWIFLCASPRWPWLRWWAPPVAGVLLWQAALAMYPGALVALVYVLAVWVVLVQVLLRPRPREYLFPLAAAACLAAAMTLLRFLPFALARGLQPPRQVDDYSIFSWRLIGTFFYPYGDNAIPMSISMRSLFLPVVGFALVGLANWRAPIARIAVGSCLTAVALGLPTLPWAGALVSLPGMNLSRFHMDDFKPFLLAGICLLAMAGAERIIQGVPTPEGRAPLREILTKWHVLYGGAVIILTALLGVRGPFIPREWLAQWSLIVAGVVITALACWFPRLPAATAIVALTFMSVWSGSLAITATSSIWRRDRVASEQLFGAPIDDLIKLRSAEGRTTTQRPPRADPGPNIVGVDTVDWHWGSAFYTGKPSLVGNVNLNGSPAFETIRTQLLGSSTSARARAFWVAPGIGLALAEGDLPGVSTTELCVQDHQCGKGVVVTPVSYSPSTPLVYNVSAPHPNTALSFNEAYYPGWQAEVCTKTRGCSRTGVRVGAAGEVRLVVPEGQSTVTLRYSLPGLTTAWFAFGGGLGGLLMWPIVRRCRRVTPT